MTRLFIVEGPPCAGKSRTAAHIAERLKRLRAFREVVCVDEGTGAHPADYEFCAYVTGEELAAFPPGLREMVRSMAQAHMNGYIVPLRRLGGAALDRLLPYKIYDSLPWEREMPLMLEKWQSFVKNTEDHTAYVFNCVLLQNPMCETMMRFNFPPERSLEYISQIVKLTAPLEPAVVYLRNDEIGKTVEAVSAERPGWLEAVINYHVSGAYGRSIGAKGFKGYVSCVEERQRRELDILEKLPVRRLVIGNAHKDWAGAYQRIDEFLGLAHPGVLSGR